MRPIIGATKVGGTMALAIGYEMAIDATLSAELYGPV
jgi:hypothetical protein